MTSPSSSSHFRLTLLKVSETLTEKNVQDLAFLCEDISTARRERITNARELFAALQGHDLLNERKVNVFIDWLDELRLLEAANLLKEYRNVHCRGFEKAQENCFVHEDLPLKYFCVSCDSKICPDCAFTSHNVASVCDVINLEKVSFEAHRRRKLLKEKLGSLRVSIEEVEKFCNDKRQFFSTIRERSRSEIHKEFLLLIQQIENMRKLEIEKICESELDDMKRFLKETKAMEGVRYEANVLGKYLETSTGNTVRDISKLSRGMKDVENFHLELERHKELLTEMTIDQDIGKVPRNEGPFCIITFSVLTGSIFLRNDELLHIFDERRSNRGVLLVCVHPNDANKEYWRHLVKFGNHRDPVAVSNKELYCYSKDHALFAVGNKVFIVSPRWTGFAYESVGKVKSLVLQEIPDGSWITNINTYNPSAHPNDNFVISTSFDQSVREYNISGSALRVIDIQQTLNSTVVSALACCRKVLAVIGRGMNDVTLIDTEDDVGEYVSLKLPTFLSGMLPVDVISTLSQWLVLYISDTAERHWKAARYDDSGEFVDVCAEGTCDNDKNVPVRITRSIDAGYVILADTTVRQFHIGN